MDRNRGITTVRRRTESMHSEADIAQMSACGCDNCIRNIEKHHALLAKNAAKTIGKYGLISQKAIGLKALQYVRNGLKVPDFRVYHREGDSTLPYPFFARPAPARPRHGFVDSRLVRDEMEFKQVVTEVEATGETVEIITMPMIQADWSAIVNLDAITYGLGHDGATSGKNAKVVPSPTNRDDFQNVFNVNMTMAQISDEGSPYMEIVSKGTMRYAVQLREGPRVSGTDRFVPRTVTVTKVVEALGDLLEWEKTVEEITSMTDHSGVVVWHPGGALSSHYSVHCIVHNIPILCTDNAPVVGEVIKPTKGPAKMVKADYVLLAKVIGAFLRSRKKPSKDILQLAIAGLHAQGMWGRDTHLVVLRGLAVASMLPTASAAIMGELRHWWGAGPGHSARGAHEMQTKPPFKLKIDSDDDDDSGVSRDFVYSEVFKMKHGDIRKMLPDIIADYKHDMWRGAFGGSNWADCSIKTKGLYDAVEDFLRLPNATSWKKVVPAWNALVNAVHNGGALLTKHISPSFMDQAARCPSVGLLNRTVANVCLNTRAWIKIANRADKKLTKVIEVAQ